MKREVAIDLARGTLARFCKKDRLAKYYGHSFVVCGDGDGCCCCDRYMVPGEIGYGGGVDYWGEGEDWYCLRCAHARMRRPRHDQIFFEAHSRATYIDSLRVFIQRGLSRHDRRAEKQWNRPLWPDRLRFNRGRP